MNIKRKLVLVSCLTLFCGMFFSQNVFAEKIGIAVDQTSIAFDADTGEVQDFVITVTNISEKTQEVYIGAMDYSVRDNNELELDRSFDEHDGIKEWISTEKEKIILDPEQSEEVVFTFKAPDSAFVGSHRGAVFFRSMPDERGDIAVQGQIAVHILVNIKGDTHASGRVNSFDIPLFVIGDIDYSAEFENTGNIHYVPYGEVIVRNVFTKGESAYKYDKHFVFPDKKFTFTVTDSIPSIFGLYRAQANFVDGEGVIRSRSDYAMGYLFPVVFITFFGVLIFLAKWLIEKRKGIDHRRMDYQQKKRVTQNLQKLADDQKKRDEKKAKKTSN